MGNDRHLKNSYKNNYFPTPAWWESRNASLRAEEEEDKGDGKRLRKENNFLFPGRENGRRVLKMREHSVTYPK